MSSLSFCGISAPYLPPYRSRAEESLRKDRTSYISVLHYLSLSSQSSTLSPPYTTIPYKPFFPFPFPSPPCNTTSYPTRGASLLRTKATEFPVQEAAATSSTCTPMTCTSTSMRGVCKEYEVIKRGLCIKICIKNCTYSMCECARNKSTVRLRGIVYKYSDIYSPITRETQRVMHLSGVSGRKVLVSLVRLKPGPRRPPLHTALQSSSVARPGSALSAPVTRASCAVAATFAAVTSTAGTCRCVRGRRHFRKILVHL